MNTAPTEIVSRARGRLGEVRHFLSEAQNHYFDPDLFRINLNACIQSSRNVTFAIQSSKSEIPNFETWYSPWQIWLKDQELLRWLVEARNRIVKQGDLKLHSLVRVGLVFAYYDAPYQEFEVPLRFNTKKIMERVNLSQLPPNAMKDAYLRIERRWISNDLVDFELVDVLGYASAVLDRIVNDLSVYLENQTSSISGLPGSPKSYDTLAPRAIFIKLSDGSTSTGFVTKKLKFNPDDGKKAEERYGVLPFSDIPKGVKPTLRQLAESVAKSARAILERDGHHETMAMLFSDTNGFRMITLEPRDNAEKYLLQRKLAKDVKEFEATSIVMVGEAWTAKIDEKMPYRRAVDSPERGESLNVWAASKNGELVLLMQAFTREGKRLRFGELIQENGVPYMLEPIRQVWGLPPFENVPTHGKKP